MILTVHKITRFQNIYYLSRQGDIFQLTLKINQKLSEILRTLVTKLIPKGAIQIIRDTFWSLFFSSKITEFLD
jgi:hypothetical protein